VEDPKKHVRSEWQIKKREGFLRRILANLAGFPNKERKNHGKRERKRQSNPRGIPPESPLSNCKILKGLDSGEGSGEKMCFNLGGRTGQTKRGGRRTKKEVMEVGGGKQPSQTSRRGMKGLNRANPGQKKNAEGIERRDPDQT